MHGQWLTLPSLTLLLTYIISKTKISQNKAKKLGKCASMCFADPRLKLQADISGNPVDRLHLIAQTAWKRRKQACPFAAWKVPWWQTANWGPHIPRKNEKGNVQASVNLLFIKDLSIIIPSPHQIEHRNNHVFSCHAR